jgi:hypothetical protein
MHRFQTLDFKAPSALPTQLIVGNSGVALARNFPEGPFSLAIDDATAVGFGLSEFGYMDIALRGGGTWKGRLLDRQGKLLARCDSAQPSKTGACAPVSK